MSFTGLEEGMVNTTTEIQLSYVRIKYQDPIVFFEYKDGTELGFPEIREVIAWAEKLSGYKPYFSFTDARVHVNVTNEGKRIVADIRNMPFLRGSAVLVKNSIYKFAANFLNEFHKPEYPFRAFTSEEEAVSWLLSLPLE